MRPINKAIPWINSNLPTFPRGPAWYPLCDLRSYPPNAEVWYRSAKGILLGNHEKWHRSSFIWEIQRHILRISSFLSSRQLSDLFITLASYQSWVYYFEKNYYFSCGNVINPTAQIPQWIREDRILQSNPNLSRKNSWNKHDIVLASPLSSIPIERVKILPSVFLSRLSPTTIMCLEDKILTEELHKKFSTVLSLLSVPIESAITQKILSIKEIPTKTELTSSAKDLFSGVVPLKTSVDNMLEIKVHKYLWQAGFSNNTWMNRILTNVSSKFNSFNLEGVTELFSSLNIVSPDSLGQLRKLFIPLIQENTLDMTWSAACACLRLLTSPNYLTKNNNIIIDIDGLNEKDYRVGSLLFDVIYKNREISGELGSEALVSVLLLELGTSNMRSWLINQIELSLTSLSPRSIERVIYALIKTKTLESNDKHMIRLKTWCNFYTKSLQERDDTLYVWHKTVFAGYQNTIAGLELYKNYQHNSDILSTEALVNQIENEVRGRIIMLKVFRFIDINDQFLVLSTIKFLEKLKSNLPSKDTLTDLLIQLSNSENIYLTEERISTERNKLYNDQTNIPLKDQEYSTEVIRIFLKKPEFITIDIWNYIYDRKNKNFITLTIKLKQKNLLPLEVIYHDRNINYSLSPEIAVITPSLVSVKWLREISYYDWNLNNDYISPILFYELLAGSIFGYSSVPRIIEYSSINNIFDVKKEKNLDLNDILFKILLKFSEALLEKDNQYINMILLGLTYAVITRPENTELHTLIHKVLETIKTFNKEKRYFLSLCSNLLLDYNIISHKYIKLNGLDIYSHSEYTEQKKYSEQNWQANKTFPPNIKYYHIAGIPIKYMIPAIAFENCTKEQFYFALEYYEQNRNKIHDTFPGILIIDSNLVINKNDILSRYPKDSVEETKQLKLRKDFNLLLPYQEQQILFILERLLTNRGWKIIKANSYHLIE